MYKISMNYCHVHWQYLVKLVLIMKLVMVMLTVFFLHANATGYAQNVTVQVKNAHLEEVLELIQQQTGYDFLYHAAELKNAKTINLNLKNASLKTVLDACMANQPLTYQIEKKTVLIKSIPVRSLEERNATGWLRQKTISGTIQDEAQNPLSGVTISVKGTQTATTSDQAGYYMIVVPAGTQSLTFSLLGYVELEKEIGSSTVLNVVLSQSVNYLDDVVVVGYGTQKRASVVGAITTINPKNLQVGTTRSMSNNLAGQLAGVIGVQRSGEPGYDNSSFWIRGISTFGNNRNPLVLVDGVVRSLNNIDPEEIESFSVLKDAAASAVYGVRGANGVILINTKRGKVGKPHVTARVEQALTQPTQLPRFVGAAEYLDVMNSIRIEKGMDPLYSQEQLDNIRNQTDPDLYPDVNWVDVISKDQASNLRANVSVSGGTNILRYALVTSYYGEDGIIDRDKSQTWDSGMKLRRYNMRSNVDINVSPSTLLRLNIGGYLQDRNTPAQSIDNLFQEAFVIPPYVHPTRYSSGEIPRTPERTNPWALATQRGLQRHSASQIESSFGLDQDLDRLVPGLKLRGLFSFDRYSNNWVTRSKDPDYYNPAVGRNEDGSLQLVIDRFGQQFLGYSTGSDWGEKSVYFETALLYSKEFAQRHNVESMLLYNQRNFDNGEMVPFRNQGLAGRFSYTFDTRYIAEFNFGYNGSENFATGKRFGFFPSFALGWFVSEEPFMESMRNSINKLKLRGSFGYVGNDLLDGRRFAYITTIENTSGYRWGVNNDYARDGRREGHDGNSLLTWETVAKANAGLELGLWNSLDLQVDLFKESRKDIFMQRRSIPGSSGFINAPWANFGQVDNRGIDLSLDFNHRFGNDFFMSVRGTYTYAANKIIEQDEPQAIVGTSRSSTGKPVGQLFGLIAEGLFTDADFQNVEQGTLVSSLPTHAFGPVRPGDIRYRDINGDGEVNELDKTAIGGTVDPQMVFGIGANMQFKGVDFGFFFQGLGKTYRIIGGANFIPGSANGSMGNMFTNVSDRWTVENPRQDVFYPRLSDFQNANNNEASTWWLRDMSFIRLKHVEVGYNFKDMKVAGAHFLKSSRLFIRGSNLLTFSKFDLWDPEIGVNNGLRYPIMKSVSLGLELNFN
jgi:TonB-linked SusC/RagA family outer membrane protein